MQNVPRLIIEFGYLLAVCFVPFSVVVVFMSIQLYSFVGSGGRKIVMAVQPGFR